MCSKIKNEKKKVGGEEVGAKGQNHLRKWGKIERMRNEEIERDREREAERWEKRKIKEKKGRVL